MTLLNNSLFYELEQITHIVIQDPRYITLDAFKTNQLRTFIVLVEKNMSEPPGERQCSLISIPEPVVTLNVTYAFQVIER